MELKVSTYEFIKQKKNDVIFTLPDETLYCFQTGVRRAIRIIPIRWKYEDNNYNKKGDIYMLNVTAVYGSSECKIVNFNVKVNERQISELISTNESIMYRDQQSIVLMLLQEDYHVKTKEQWEGDWNSAMNKIEEYE